MTIPARWLHIATAATNHSNIIKRIYSALNDAGIEKSNKLIRYGMSLSDRLDLIHRVCNGLVYTEDQIYSQIRNHTDDHAFEPGKSGYAIKIEQKLIFDFLINLDSLLFELNSGCELIGRFFEEFHIVSENQLPQKKSTGKQISEILQKYHHDDTWFKKLDEIRNYFIHEGCPYFSVDITEVSLDILIMKKNLHCFNNEEDYYRLSEIKKIYEGFNEFLSIIERYLIDLLRKKA